jgi:hypothetical protein
MVSFMEARMGLYSVGLIVLSSLVDMVDADVVADMCTAITMQTVSTPGYWEYVTNPAHEMSLYKRRVLIVTDF